MVRTIVHQPSLSANVDRVGGAAGARPGQSADSPGKAASGSTPNWCATTLWRSPACWSIKIGGPSVKPYQPDGYWENLNFPPRSYEADKGENQYRRGLYTWWQRSFLHPSMLAFDAPTREECAAERSRSNIPQQALVLLNDPTYVEAARAFAARITAARGRQHRRRGIDLGLAAGSAAAAARRRVEPSLATLLEQQLAALSTKSPSRRRELAHDRAFPSPGRA